MLPWPKEFFFERTTRNTFLLTVFLAGLFFSKAILSISVGLLAIHWLADKNLHLKLKGLWKDKAILIFLIIYFLHLVGLLYTSDFAYAFKDIKTKIPFLVIPLIVATEPRISRIKVKAILHSMYLFACVSALISMWIYFTADNSTLRNITPFMSHIRFSLILSLVSVFMIYDFFSSENRMSFVPLLKFVTGLLLIVFTVVVIASFNGIILLAAGLFFGLIYAVFSVKHIRNKLIIGVLVAMALLVPFYLALSFHNQLFPEEVHIHCNYAETTMSGNKYSHDPDYELYENGIPVMMYYCEEEMRKQWNLISSVSYDFSAQNGFPMREVLMRYLTSAGLTKDSAGISKLTQGDISEIEKGITNVQLVGRSPFSLRLYEFFNGYYNYKRSGNPNDNSLFLRLEFWKAATAIIQRFPFSGVGTGDVNTAFQEQYEMMNSPLEKRWRVRSHNQYLSFGVAFGIPGILLFLLALIVPALLKKKFKSFYFTTIFIVLLLSMITEDTIETQIGASLFAFFYCFFLYYPENQRKLKEIKSLVQPDDQNDSLNNLSK